MIKFRSRGKKIWPSDEMFGTEVHNEKLMCVRLQYAPLNVSVLYCLFLKKKKKRKTFYRNKGLKLPHISIFQLITIYELMENMMECYQI